MKAIIIIIALLSYPYLAKSIEIKKINNKKNNLTDEKNLARINFLNFVRCQRVLEDKRGEGRLKNCMGQFLHLSIRESRKLQYVQFFQIIDSISEPYNCPNEIVQTLKTLEEDYDILLCFDSYGKMATQTGFLLFKNEKSVPMLFKIKL